MGVGPPGGVVPSSSSTVASLGVLVGIRTDADPARSVELAILADLLGFREVMIGEATGHDAFALATAMGRGPARVTVGPLPAAVRDPVTIARGAASVAALTGRRVDVALSASTSTVVEDWHGRSRGESAAVVAESALVLRGAPNPPTPNQSGGPGPGVATPGVAASGATGGLLAGHPVDFSGSVLRTRGYSSALAPSYGSVSILAFGAELTEVAVARADRIIVPLGTVEHMARLRGRIQLAAERAGRAIPRLALWLPVAIDPDETVRRDLLRSLAPYLRAPGFAGMFTEAGFGELIRLARSGAHIRSVVAAAPPDLLSTIGAVGSVAAVRAALAEYRAVGVDDLLLVPDRPETLEALAAPADADVLAGPATAAPPSVPADGDGMIRS